MFLSRGDRDLGDAFQTHPGRQAFLSSGSWNVGFFRKNGYLLRGELKDVPKGHDCYELFKVI